MNHECKDDVATTQTSADSAETPPGSPQPGKAPKLYMFYLGGSAGRSNIELHDIQFAAVHQPKDAWPALRDAWFGDRDKVHLDGYAQITWADGHAVRLRRGAPAPAPGDPSRKGDDTGVPRLYFVYAGGYRSDCLAEQHDFGLFVATDAASARRRAMKQLLPELNLQHKDSLKDVDSCILLDCIDGWHVELTPQPGGEPDRPQWQGYQPIGA